MTKLAGLKLDLNYNFKTDGFIAIAKALTPEALVRTPAYMCSPYMCSPCASPIMMAP